MLINLGDAIDWFCKDCIYKREKLYSGSTNMKISTNDVAIGTNNTAIINNDTNLDYNTIGIRPDPNSENNALLVNLTNCIQNQALQLKELHDFVKTEINTLKNVDHSNRNQKNPSQQNAKESWVTVLKKNQLLTSRGIKI